MSASKTQVIDLPPDQYTVHTEQVKGPGFVMESSPTRNLGHDARATRVVVPATVRPGETRIEFADDEDPTPNEENPVNARPANDRGQTPPPTADGNNGGKEPPRNPRQNGGEEIPQPRRQAPTMTERFETIRQEGRLPWWLIIAFVVILVGVVWWLRSPSTTDKAASKTDDTKQYYPPAQPPVVKTLAQLRAEEATLRGQLLQMQRLNPRSPEKEWQMQDRIRTLHDQILTLEAEESAHGTSIFRGSRGKGLQANIDWDGNGRIVLEAEDNDACRTRLEKENLKLQMQLQQKPQAVIINQTVPYGSRRLGIYR